MMQPHTDKLSHMERWKVIHYIRSLQAVSLGEDYNPVKKVNVSPVEEAHDALSEDHGEAHTDTETSTED